MTTLPTTLHDRSDRASVLARILQMGRPRAGVTLVAVLELSSGAILHVRHLATPEPLPESVCSVPGELSMLMSPTLCSLAESLVPPPDRKEGGGFSPPDQELVTVVCRDGEPTPGPSEEQFFWGWRYSNHLTAAFHGDVYVVTPTGWAGLLGGGGAEPALTASPGVPPAEALIDFPDLEERCALLLDPAVRAAEAVLAAAALDEMVPGYRECLLCYEARLFALLGCDRTLRVAQRFREVSAPRATALESRLRRRGVACDCQLLEIHAIRSAVLDVEESSGADAGFGCYGVRGGSTQPCWAWVALQ